MKYRHRPLVDAIQWDGTVDGAQAVAVFVDKPIGYFRFYNEHIIAAPSPSSPGATLFLERGDWLVRTSGDQYAPWGDGAFKQTFEPLADDAAEEATA